jgi:acyl carrier protein
MDRKLTTVLADVFRLRESEINPSLTKSDVGNWDSLRQMDLVMSLEREYRVDFEMSDIVKLVSVKGIVDVLRDKGVDLAD